MTEIRRVRQHGKRVVYPVSFCDQSYTAMKYLQERLRESSQIEYSLSVIARALGLNALRHADTSPEGELVALCRWCGSKGAKQKSARQEDNDDQ